MLTEDLLLFILTSVFCLVGSYAKEYLRLWNHCAAELSTKRIFVAAATATLVSFGLSDDLLSRFGMKGYPMSCFFIGLIGFELLERMSNIDGFLDVVRSFFKGGSNKDE